MPRFSKRGGEVGAFKKKGGKKICRKEYVMLVARKRKCMEARHAKKDILYAKSATISMAQDAHYVGRL